MVRALRAKKAALPKYIPVSIGVSTVQPPPPPLPELPPLPAAPPWPPDPAVPPEEVPSDPPASSPQPASAERQTRLKTSKLRIDCVMGQRMNTVRRVGS